LTPHPIDESEAALYRQRFPIFDRKVYLNSCSLGPLSRDSRAGLDQYADDWSEFGAPAWWHRWIPRIDEIRALFARAINAETSRVTIHHSVSSALSSVASAIDYSRRNKVVVSEIDFPTIAYQWLVKPEVDVVFARSADGVTIPLEEYERLVDDRTAAVATSHVFYATGAVQDIRAITEIAHRKGALSIVDGYHSVGVLPVDVEAAGVDFFVGGTLKWVCGGPGLTFIYAAPATLDLSPRVTGWFAAREQFAFETMRFEPADSAARFQLGTPAVATVYTGLPALSFLLDVGLDRIYDRIQKLTAIVVERARELGWEVASPVDARERGGIVMLRLPDPPAAVAALEVQNIIVDARPGKLRISPHFFNTRKDVDRCMDGLVAAMAPATRQQSVVSRHEM
jgi:selenocysteine lyase/cysteine desulfurase